ncbi:DUF3826 domain-containing protein [Hymenobacter aerilatus]|uniref:DUF3826 domain-containing protein n=1 Tax=Hymenobacter aerilatus TaxID=2932251 RepID=A0A8T9SRD9_9BACT|nr:DUF3826 domain-containing protein [Hymenobacter aerilatus]UOR03584.1 DUF3826 domain-containing protein [Hymenobacter aerilatus]
MSYTLHRLLLAGFVVTAPFLHAAAQSTAPSETPEAAYTRVVTERAAKIVATIQPLEPKKVEPVRDLIAEQYRRLNDLDEQKKAQLTALKAQPKEAQTEEAKKAIEAKSTAALTKLHAQYLKKLGRHLSPAQIDQVKDGMTYGVLPITIKAYNDMLPNLTEAQKTQIVAWLTEAREHAMDAGSSKEKHAWFGKYKGKINNYLSAAGIDMNQAGKDWQARRAAANSK